MARCSGNMSRIQRWRFAGRTRQLYLAARRYMQVLKYAGQVDQADTPHYHIEDYLIMT